MDGRRFLTVMAVLDGKTQAMLEKMQAEIIRNVGAGTQTMGIPFHVTLGSYPTESEADIVDKIKQVASNCARFEIELTGYNTFGDKVLFAEPTRPRELIELRKCFEFDYANGFEWVPHATVFCGDRAEVIKARELLPEISEPIKAEIVGIELGEFFPPRKIIRVDFEN